jgi:hypothetical protein
MVMTGKYEILVPPDQENARRAERQAKGLCVCKPAQTRYIERFDATYCVACKKWNEGKCGDAECEYCAGRPEHPAEEDYG